MVVKGASPDSVLCAMGLTISSPVPPLELQRFIELNQISSEKLSKTT